MSVKRLNSEGQVSICPGARGLSLLKQGGEADAWLRDPVSVSTCLFSQENLPQTPVPMVLWHLPVQFLGLLDSYSDGISPYRVRLLSFSF